MLQRSQCSCRCGARSGNARNTSLDALRWVSEKLLEVGLDESMDGQGPRISVFFDQGQHLKLLHDLQKSGTGTVSQIHMLEKKGRKRTSSRPYTMGVLQPGFSGPWAARGSRGSCRRCRKI